MPARQQISPGHAVLAKWLKLKSWKLAAFQKEAMEAYLAGKSGLVNAPTGSGKTYSLWLPVLVDFLNSSVGNAQSKPGVKVLWITPLRALAKDLHRNMQQACSELGIPWEVGIRTGDTKTKERTAQKKQMPPALIITPESLHLLFAQKNSNHIFSSLHTVIVDEWHELMGSKRGVQTELALSRLRKLNPNLRSWGISATIGNLEEAGRTLLGIDFPVEKMVIVKAGTKKKIIVETILPDKVETLPWSGYLGIRLLDKVVDIIRQSRSTLLFTNTRNHTETWYQAIIENYPEFAGVAALHHGSLDKEMRNWVEEALHDERLRLVICTSSLDLGVDFRPVETVIQVGSPKSVSRFVQRAGRSGHQPGASSKIYFTPTNSLELIEAVALREGVQKNILEERPPVINAFDVLAQWMVTLAVGDGFYQQELFREIRTTTCFQFIEKDEWNWLLGYITTGSSSLEAYDEFRKVEVKNGLFVVRSRRVALRHRLSIGTIMSDASLRVKFQHGKFLGTIEEAFLSRLKPGDVFWFAGQSVQMVRIREMTVTVKRDTSKKAIVPQWLGGRLSLSPVLASFIRTRLADALENPHHEIELKKLHPLLQLQNKRSYIPCEDEMLIEQYSAREGHHLFIFPFEGRIVHEGMAALLAYRISRIVPITFSIAMNDYGFELLSDQEVDLQKITETYPLFTTDNLLEDIQKSVNATEMSKRRFRQIAAIAGLIFQGYPGRQVKTRQLQSSSSLLFEVMLEYEKDNLFIRQAFQEVLDDQLAEPQLRLALMRIMQSRLVLRRIEKPSPLSFPLLVDRAREQLSSEKLESRVQKMIKEFS